MVKILFSKRNKVVKIGKIVCKSVKNPILAKGELLRLRLLKKRGLFVPTSYGHIKNNIFLGYVDGTPIPDWLISDSLTKEDIEAVCSHLIHWLKSFYSCVKHDKTGIILQDVNCRNFLVCKENKICGVDFEGFSSGVCEDNIGELAVFINSYDHCDKNKKIFAQCFLKSAIINLNLDAEIVLEKVKQAQERLLERRKTNNR